MRLGRLVLAIGCLLLLFFTPILSAVAGNTVNLAISIVVIPALVAIGIYFWQARWLFALVLAVFVAVPPYPYWVFENADSGWYFHFFQGFPENAIPFGRFATVAAIALILAASIFSVVGEKAQKLSAGKI